MTTLDKIKAEIQKVLDKERDFTSENAKAQALALLWVLELFDKYASEECDNDCEHCTWIECPKEPSEDMTREEAIRIIDRRKTCMECIASDIATCEKCDEAFDMAISALNQEPCEDAVSRQAVQDYIAKYLSQYLYEDVRQAVEDIDVYIGDLPSVQPKPETVTEFADRCRECGAKYGKLLKQVTKTGKWLKYSYARKCSECGSITCWTDDEGRAIPDNYCPNCGAKMVEQRESEE